MFDHKQIMKVLNLPEEDVEIALAASGGAFGAKEELSIQAQTAMAAFLLGKPVKTVLTREQSTQHHVKRHPMYLKLKVAADAQGHLVGGSRAHVGDPRYAGTSGKCYSAPRAIRAARTGAERRRRVASRLHENQSDEWPMRGFGSNQAQFAMEGMMDILADKIGVDNWDIANGTPQPGDAFATGQVMRESVRGMRNRSRP